MSNSQQTSLFSEFPPVTPEQWLEVVQADLKGADFEKRLVTRTEDGIRVLPLYFSSDAPPDPQMPGLAPFQRGYQADGNSWAVREFIATRDAEQANSRALDALMRGAEQVEFSLEAGVVADEAFLGRLVKGIDLQAAKVCLSGTELEPKLPGVAVVEDPIATALACGTPVASVIQAAVARIRASQNAAAVGISGLAIQEAEGSAAQEIAYVLGALVELLDAATEAGMEAKDVLDKVEFRFGSGTQYLVEIAKIRAARSLLYRILQGYGSGDVRPTIHVQTSRSSLTVYDPHVNMLRATTQAMAAAVAGADSISVVPYDAAFRESDDLARRIARNVQIILRDESYLGKVADPLGGSYAIEALTRSLAEAAWTLFLRYEDDGGLVGAWRNGWPSREIEEVRRARLKAASSRRQPIVGTSNYPNQKESGPDRLEPHLGSAPGDLLAPCRPSAPFEVLRMRADRAARRPVVALILAGDPKMSKARATFVTGFYGAGGYSVVEISEPELSQAAKRAEEAGADIVVLCSSDAEYVGIARPLVDAMTRINLEAHLVVAGNPTDSIEELKSIGVQEFVHLRCDVVETLTKTHALLGIPEVQA